MTHKVTQQPEGTRKVHRVGGSLNGVIDELYKTEKQSRIVV